MRYVDSHRSALLAPPQASVLILLCVVCLILVAFGWRLDRKIPVSIACLAALSLFLVLVEFYSVQTGHTIALALSFVALTTAMADSRNQTGNTRWATIDGDTRAILYVVVIVTFALMYFDVVARVNGSQSSSPRHGETDVRSAGETVMTSDLHIGELALADHALVMGAGCRHSDWTGHRRVPL